MARALSPGAGNALALAGARALLARRKVGRRNERGSADPETGRLADRLTPGRHDRVDVSGRIIAAERVEQRLAGRPRPLYDYGHLTVDQVHGGAAQSQLSSPRPYPVAEADALDPPAYAGAQPSRIVHPASLADQRGTHTTGGRPARSADQVVGSTVAQKSHWCSTGSSVVDTVLPVGRNSITGWVSAVTAGQAT